MNVAAFGIVIKNDNILLVNRRFPPQLWAPPGGFVDKGELPEETVERETWEETGIRCKVLSQVYEFDFNDSHLIVYICDYISGELQCSYESLEVRWFHVDELPSPISPDTEVFKKAIVEYRSIQ